MAKEKKEVSRTWADSLARIEKEYGKGSVMKMSEKSKEVYDTISTGSVAFDIATGISGFALGRMYEMQGWEGTGKTTICGEITANFQKKYPSKRVLYIDSEHSLDLNYFKALGVKTDEMFLSQPYSCEEGFNIVLELIQTGEVGLIIIDSDTALKPLTQAEGKAGDSSIGKKAKLNSDNYPTIKNLAHKHNVCVIIISQFREKIGVMFGSPVTTSGGNALRFTADVILEVSKTILKDGEQQYGNQTKIKIKKNKLAPPFVLCSFDIVYGQGIDKIGEIITLAEEAEILSQRKSKDVNYITLKEGENETKYSEDDFRALLTDNEEFKAALVGRLNGVVKLETDEIGKAEEEKELKEAIEILDAVKLARTKNENHDSKGEEIESLSSVTTE